MSNYVRKTQTDTNNNAHTEKRMRTSPESMDGSRSMRISPDAKDRRTHPNPSSNPDCACVCYRKTTGIFCFNCRYRKDNVRRRLSCPSHPNYLWLMDLPVCPKCQKDTHLTELTH